MLDKIIFRLFLVLLFAFAALFAFLLLALCLFFPGKCLQAFAAMVYITHRRLFGVGGRFEVQEGVMSWKKEDRAEYFENPN